LGPFNRSIDEVEAFMSAKYNHGTMH